MPTTRQLEIFLSVVRHGSMRRAADEAGISQPSVSKHIRLLEAQLGGALFVRRRGARVAPSALGEKLQQDATDIVRRQRDFLQSAHKGAAPDRIRLYVGYFLFAEMVDLLAEMQLPPWNTPVTLEVFSAGKEAAEQIRQDANSAALYRAIALPNDEAVDCTILRIEPSAIYASPDYAAKHWANGRFGPDFRLLMPQQGGFGQWVLDQLADHALGPDAIEAGPLYSSATLKKAVDGEVAGVFIESLVADEVAKGTLVPLPPAIKPVYLTLACNRDMPPNIRRALRSELEARLA